MTLYMMVGAPGSGKSTYAQHLQAEIGDNCVYISRDNVRLSVITDNDAYFSHEDEVYEKFVSQIAETLHEHDVIADATHLSHAGRFKLVKALEKHDMPADNYDLVCVVMKTPLEVCIERDKLREGRRHVTEPVIRNMWRSFRAPWPHEFSNLKEVRFV